MTIKRGIMKMGINLQIHTNVLNKYSLSVSVFQACTQYMLLKDCIAVSMKLLQVFIQ